MEQACERGSRRAGQLTPGAIVWNSSAPGKMKRACPVLALALLLLVASTSPTAAQPQVTKVEPPSWWSGHTWNPVRVLVRGSALQGARVEVVGEGLTVGLVRVNAAGSYLFVDLHVDPAAVPGARQLRIATPSGTTEAPFDIAAPLSPEAGFQGFSTDDVIYLVMPDRFSGRRRGQQRPRRVARALRPRQGPLLPRRRLRRHRREASVSQRPGHHGALAEPVVRQRQPPQREGAVRQPPDHRLPRVRRRRFLRRRRALRRRWPTCARSSRPPTRLGIKVIQDQVANHTGPYHPWVADPPTPTWFNGTEAKHAANTWQTWTLQDPHASPQTRRETLDGWFIDILPDLNQQDDEVARYIIQNTLWWVGVLGLDGIRQDTWPYVPARVLAALDGGAQARVSAPHRRGRAVRRRSRHRVVLLGRRGPVRRHRHEGRFALRFPALLHNPPRVRGRQAAAGRRADARARSPVSRSRAPRRVPRQSRHARGS